MKASHENGRNGQPGRERQSMTGRALKARRLKVRELLAREVHLLRVDFWLEGKVSGRRRKDILRGLRDDMAAESVDHGMPVILAGLGKPRTLAAEYAQANTSSRIRWNAGAVAAALALVTYLVVFLSYTLGMLAVAGQLGGEFHSRFLVVDVMAFSTAEGIGIGWSGTAFLWFPLALMALAFISCSRPWRHVRRSAAT